MEEESNELEYLIDDLRTRIAEEFYQTIQILSTISAMQEKFYISSHSRFVAQKSALIATELGLSETEVFEIQIAGLLHDLGKLGFSDTLNSKTPTEMNEHEYFQYKLHPEIGRKLLEKHKSFKNISEIILHHHEKMDGSGFPNQLTTTYINPGALILIVVDTYHNIVAKQKKDRHTVLHSTVTEANMATYMEATQPKFAAAMNFIHSKAGIAFDKKVVNCFTEIMESERRLMGQKTVMRLPVNTIETGMEIAEDYSTTYGLLIAARGDLVTDEMKWSLIRYAEAGLVPRRVMVMR